ncbi:MAG TPA: DUF309 domain-containing protein [Kofleriaceae bacterium]|nr:DUF309 domain-containing protein [Kofleriaceae bacterium]
MREALLRGAVLFDTGDYFEAHEVWEGAWRAAGDPEAQRLLQGLIQCAAAAIKVREGTWSGASTLMERASANLAGLRDPALDLAGLLAALRVAVHARDPSAAIRCRP